MKIFVFGEAFTGKTAITQFFTYGKLREDQHTCQETFKKQIWVDDKMVLLSLIDPFAENTSFQQWETNI